MYDARFSDDGISLAFLGRPAMALPNSSRVPKSRELATSLKPRRPALELIPRFSLTEIVS